MADYFEKWSDKSVDNRKMLAEEKLILDVTEQLWSSMEDKNLSKTDVAELLGKSKSYLSQLLSGSRNMTLRTLADLCFVLNIKPKFNIDNDGLRSCGRWKMQRVESRTYVKKAKLVPAKRSSEISRQIRPDKWAA